MKFPFLFFSLALLLLSEKVWSYPSFIGYGYKSCATCHFNSHGNGPLNDYGRALMATEISARAFYNPRVTDEEMGDRSGFLGKTELPAWFRPHIKTRLMYLLTDPGGSASKTSFIPMQFEAGTALIFNKQWTAVMTAGYMPPPRALKNSKTAEQPSNIITREHYLRWIYSKEWIFYAGLMDKVFGIRTEDHTAFNRAKTGLAMNDQAHGAVMHYISKEWEFTLNPFIGNLSQGSDLRQQGASAMYEYNLGEKSRLGASALSSQNSYVRWNRLSLHHKFGYGLKNSLLTEFGLIEDSPKNEESKSTGGYAFVQSTSNISQGYNVISQFEFYNKTMSPKSPDQLKWTIGLLMFPAPRFEFRTTLVNLRSQADAGVTNDQWQAQAQLHVSL